MPEIILISSTVIYFIIYFIIAAKSGKPFKTIAFHAFVGVVCTIIINLTAKFSGIHLPINGYTLGASATLGLPGTIGLLLLRLIFA